jgi:hypothetical protein
MIKFEELVESFLLEQDADEDTKKGMAGFLTPEVYSTLKAAYETKYANKELFPFPTSIGDLNNIAQTVVTSFPRSIKDPKRYQNLIAVYPLLDLFAQLYQVYKKGGSGNPVDAKAITENFIKQLKDPNVSDIPMEFPTKTVWAKDVKKEHYSSTRQDLGKARLDIINPNLSIYSVVLYLLAIRKQALKPKIPVDKIPPADNFVKDIFFNPQVYLSGKKPLPDQKIKALYNDVAVEDLLKISNAAHELFIQQATNNLGIDSKTQKPNFKDERRAYAEFLGSGALVPTKPMDWMIHKKTEETSPQNLTPQNASFNQSFELFNKQMLNEIKPTSRTTYTSTGSRTTATSGPGVVTSDSAQSSSTQSSEENKSKTPDDKQTNLKPFEKQEGQFVYDLASLKNYQNEIPQVANLYNQLMNLANYIQKEGSVDWMDKISGGLSGATQIAKGLSLGVPTMGR